MCLLEILFGFVEGVTKSDDKGDNLEEWQKDLIKSGEYEPYDFEEESDEKDSYYNEDDKD